MAPGPESWKPAVIAGYPMLRERAKELEKHGLVFLDASQTFADTSATLYFDPCHFAPEGSRLLGQRIAPYFLGHVLGEQRNGVSPASASHVTAEAR